MRYIGIIFLILMAQSTFSRENGTTKRVFEIYCDNNDGRPDTIIEDIMKKAAKVMNCDPQKLWVEISVSPHSPEKENLHIENDIYIKLKQKCLNYGVKRRQIWHSLLLYFPDSKLQKCNGYEIFIGVRDRK